MYEIFNESVPRSSSGRLGAVTVLDGSVPSGSTSAVSDTKLSGCLAV
jgi:hypothetical protein